MGRSCMKQHEQALVLLEKARQDEALVNEVLPAEHISDEIIGFHCQQAVEKLLKAVLVACGVHFHRTHNLRQLMDLLGDAGRPVPEDLNDLDTLTPFAVVHRYETPRIAASLNRREALELVRRLREWV